MASNEPLHLRKNKHEAGDSFECGICGTFFKSLSEIEEHETECRNRHSAEEYRNERCSYSPNYTTNMTPYEPTHTGERTFECEYCGKSFKQRQNLVNHIRIHTGERPYKCDQCDMTFTRKDYLNNHKRTHSEERPFECERCGSNFKTRSGLTMHMSRNRVKQVAKQ